MNFDSFVLAGSTDDLTTEPEARDAADAIEFRMDLAQDPESSLAQYDGQLPVIATNRVAREGGNAQATPARLDLLRTAATHESVGAIDIELSELHHENGVAVIDHAHDSGTGVIVSVHDFEGTPSKQELRDDLRDATQHGTVGKLAVTAHTPRDVLALLDVTWAFASDDAQVATMAMGEIGRHSRLVAPIYGSKIGYAPVDPDHATAPGQFELTTFRYLLDTIGLP